MSDQIDAWPTQAMESEALASLANEASKPSPASVPRPSPSVRPPASTHPPVPTRASGAPSAPGATQAVRVVCWRTSDGIAVAPPGTVVPAPTVEAVLVALDPAADLAEWLHRRR